jgi:hypothetical protein
MSKMGSHRPFGDLKHKLWAKERLGVKVLVWLPTIKSWESTDFWPCRQRATYRWKTLDKGYNFFLDLITIEGLHTRLCALKVAKVPDVQISKLPLGSFGTKSHLDVATVESYIIYYKGEGGGFPQVRAMVCLVSPSCPWLVLAPKVLQLCTNHFVLVLCRSMWIIEACHFFLVPSWSSNKPFYPSQVLQAKALALIFCSSAIFILGLTFESLKEFGTCHVKCIVQKIATNGCDNTITNY